jgi:hypothetical protein
MKYSSSLASVRLRWVFLLAAVFLVGCGGTDGLSRCSVSGKVTLDGAPVEEGSITFVPTEGTSGPMAFGEIADGEYAISADERGPVVGKHKVQIEAYRDSGTKDSGGAPLKDQVVPAKYNTQTTLVVEIAEGSGTHNFDLTSQ